MHVFCIQKWKDNYVFTTDFLAIVQSDAGMQIWTTLQEYLFCPQKLHPVNSLNKNVFNIPTKVLYLPHKQNASALNISFHFGILKEKKDLDILLKNVITYVHSFERVNESKWSFLITNLRWGALCWVTSFSIHKKKFKNSKFPNTFSYVQTFQCSKMSNKKNDPENLKRINNYQHSHLTLQHSNKIGVE